MAIGPYESPLRINTRNIPSKKKKKKKIILLGCWFLGQADVTWQITRSEAAGRSDDFWTIVTDSTFHLT